MRIIKNLISYVPILSFESDDIKKYSIVKQ